MATRKYNWAKEKAEFMKSPISEVKEYFEGKHGAYNQHIQGSTKGWTKEKESRQKESIEEALKEMKEKDKNEWIKVFSNINQARKVGLNDLAKEIVEKKKDISIKEAIEVLKHFRLELGETTENTKQQNELSEEDRKRVDLLLEMNL